MTSTLSTLVIIFSVYFSLRTDSNSTSKSWIWCYRSS